MKIIDETWKQEIQKLTRHEFAPGQTLNETKSLKLKTYMIAFFISGKVLVTIKSLNTKLFFVEQEARLFL